MSHPSMTGFGTANLDCPVGRLTLEIKSVNSRYFEFNPRLPDEFRWAEQRCRERLQQTVGRGKVEFRFSLFRTESSLSKTRINVASLASALRLSHEIRQDHPEIAPFSVSDLLKLPGVLQESELSQEQWIDLFDILLTQALSHFTTSRIQEGERLLALITDRINQIEGLASRAESLIPLAIAHQQQRLADKLREALGHALVNVASPTAEQLIALEDRIRQEVAAFSLRIDIAEEIDRLRSHLQAARQAIAQKTAVGIGKRLDFLTQEMNREANTLGSKSASADLSNISIELKLLIEQIREQVQNLE